MRGRQRQKRWHEAEHLIQLVEELRYRRTVPDDLQRCHRDVVTSCAHQVLLQHIGFRSQQHPSGTGTGSRPGNTSAIASTSKATAATVRGSFQLLMQMRPAVRVTRANSRRPARQSGRLMTPNIEKAMSNVSSSNSSACASMTVAEHAGNGASRCAARSTIGVATSVATTWAPSEAAATLSPRDHRRRRARWHLAIYLRPSRMRMECIGRSAVRRCVHTEKGRLEEPCAQPAEDMTIRQEVLPYWQSRLRGRCGA